MHFDNHLDTNLISKTIKRYITSNLIPILNENITICREKDTVGWLQISRIVEFFKKKKILKIQNNEVANYFVKLHSSKNNIDTVLFNVFVWTIITTITLGFFPLMQSVQLDILVKVVENVVVDTV